METDIQNNTKPQFNPLIHELGKETRIVVNKADKVKEGNFFYHQYEKASSIAASIVKNQKNDNDEYDQIENFNNIITFIGDRGSGKTSCMLTFANLLDALSNNLTKEIKETKESFYVLPTIDPSFFVSAYNIIGAFIAGIYNKFKAELDKCSNKENDYVDEGKIQDFYQALSKAQKSFGRLYAEKRDDMDDMERLEQLSCSMNLKEEIKKLTNAFLCCMGGKTKLVVCIDDIDLNTKTAVDILEWIRKYLIQPNIIILFSVKLDQMYDLKRMDLYTEYKELLQKEKISDAEIDEMTEKYITKLFPLAQRIYLPNADNLPRVKYQYVKKDKNGNAVGFSETEEIRDIVVKTIYEKTRFLFYNYELKTNLIVPDNIRDVLYLMRLLNDMEVVPSKDKPDRRDVLKRNQQRFKDFFVNNWLNKKLDFESREEIHGILKNPDTDQLNGRVLWMVKNRCKTILEYKKFKLYNKEYNDSILTEISHVLNDQNNTYNISMGDTMWIINWLYNMVRSREETYFLFAVKTIYSIKLFEFYDEMTKGVEENNTNENHLQPTDNLIKKRNYHLLLNGQFFNQILSCFYIAEKGINGVITLKDKWVDVKQLRKCFNSYDKTKDKNDDKWKLLEFVMLCSSIHNSGNKTNDDNLYRMKPHARYSLPIGSRREYVKFDVCTFFYNITDIESCYNRFKPLFSNKNAYYDFINREHALWREFLFASKNPTINTKTLLRDCVLDLDTINKINYELDYRNFYCCDSPSDIEKCRMFNCLHSVTTDVWHDWLSWVCIRNIEVYQDFIEYMESHRERTSKTTLSETIIAIFENIACYHQKIYNDKEKKKAYGINYSYAFIISNFLRSMSYSCSKCIGLNECKKCDTDDLIRNKCIERLNCIEEHACLDCNKCAEYKECGNIFKDKFDKCHAICLNRLITSLPGGKVEPKKEGLDYTELVVTDGNKARHYKKCSNLKIEPIQVDIDKMPEVRAKVDSVKINVDSMPELHADIDPIKVDIDKMPELHAKVDSVKINVDSMPELHAEVKLPTEENDSSDNNQ